jgi:hypothetical protein
MSQLERLFLKPDHGRIKVQDGEPVTFKGGLKASMPAAVQRELAGEGSMAVSKWPSRALGT